MGRRLKVVKLNEIQKSQAMRIFAHGVNESTLHIRNILLSGRNIFTRDGIEVTLGRAFRRRRRCMKLFKQALRGFIT